MRRRPPRSKRTDTHFPDTTFFRSLEEEGLAARALTLVCLRVDGAEQRLSIGTARATRDAAHLTRLFAMKLATIEPGFRINAMRLVAIRCQPLGPVAIANIPTAHTHPHEPVPLTARPVGPPLNTPPVPTT